MKSLAQLVAMITLVALIATTAMAFSGGNPRKGKFLFKQNCKSCHIDGGSASNLTPMLKTQGQWSRFFDRDGHQADPAVWQSLSEQDQKDIQQYLFNHAADSDQPETCG